jgi:hypothetical protein
VQGPSFVDMVSRLFEMCVCTIGVRRAILTSYQDIRNLLTDWADEIHQCERIWIRASASNKRIFLDYDDAVIAKGKFPREVSGCAIHEQSLGDERLRTFPFPTRRPVSCLDVFNSIFSHPHADAGRTSTLPDRID